MKLLASMALWACIATPMLAQSIESPPNIGVNGVSNTFTGVQTINSSSIYPLSVTGGSGEDIKFLNNGSVPLIASIRTDTGLAANTTIGEWTAIANNSASTAVNFVEILPVELVDTAGAEQGKLNFSLANGAGGTTTYVQIIPGALNLLNSTSLQVAGHVLISGLAPTISSGFGTGASVANNNGAAAFTLGVGTSNTGTGVVSMPAASNGWACQVNDLTTKNANQVTTQVKATSTTSVTVQNYTDVMATHAWTDSDVLQFQCAAY